jgi:hypothetical protein
MIAAPSKANAGRQSSNRWKPERAMTGPAIRLGVTQTGMGEATPAAYGSSAVTIRQYL